MKNHTIVILAFLASFLYAADAKIEKYSVNTSSVPRFDKFEIKVTKIQAEYANPFHFGEIEISGQFISPNGRRWEIPGFYDGSNFCVRFSPDETGKWIFTLTMTDRNGSFTTEPDEFVCVPSGHHGRITQLPDDRRYLGYSDSTAFVGLGQNLPWWIERYPQFWNLMQTSGCNLFTYWLPSWDHSLLLSNSYKQYDTFSADQIDAVIEKCEQTGIHLIFTIWNAEWFAEKSKDNIPRASWDKNPFREMCQKPADFFTDKKLWQWQENYYKYIVARWGYSRAIAMWQPLQGQPDRISAEAVKWANRVCTTFEELDPFQHPVAVDPTLTNLVSESANRISHISISANPKEPERVGRLVEARATTISQKGDAPICFGSLYPADNKSLEPDIIHNALWSALANGAAVLPLFSATENMDPAILPEVFVQAKPLVSFVEKLALQPSGKKPMAILDAPGADAWGRMGENDGFGWIVRAPKSSAPEKLAITVPRNSCYELTWYNPWDGEFIGPERTYASDNRLTINPPPFDKDMAFHLREVRKAFSEEDFTELSGWEIIRARWEIEDEALAGRAKEDSAAIILSGGHDWRHYEVHAQVSIRPNSVIEIIAREKDMDYYSAKISEKQSAIMITIGGQSIELAKSATGLAPDKWHDIRFALSENQLVLFLNDQQVISTSNDRLSQGGIGLAVLSGEARFDDLRIERDTTPPAAPLLLSELPPTQESNAELAGWKSWDTDSVIIEDRHNGRIHAKIMDDSTWSAEVPIAGLGLNRLSLYSTDRSGNNSDTVYTFINRFEGELLLHESFKDFDEDAWTVHGGQWMSDSSYLQVAPDNIPAYVIRNQDFGQGCAASLRALLPGNGSLLFPFCWQNEENYYLLHIQLQEGEEDNVRLEKRVNGSPVPMAEAVAHLRFPGQPGWITLLIETADEQIKITVNGRLMLESNDNTFTHGRFGLGADVPALFDDLTAFRQETTVVETGGINDLLYRLDQNYPNPFNPLTTIRFSLPKQEQVTLYVFNVLGKKVATLAEEPLPQGEHQVEWSGLDDQGNPVSAGVYFYELTAGQFRSMRKMIFAK